MKTYLIAISENGKRVMRVKNSNPMELQNLINEENREIAKEKQEKAKLFETIENLKNDISLLKHEIRVLKGEENDEESN